MAKRIHDYIDQFLEEADTVIVPEEFISAACVTYKNGEEHYITFDEASELINKGSYNSQGIESIRAVIDLKAVRKVVADLTEEVLSHARA